jgi:hypothetical protein
MRGDRASSSRLRDDEGSPFRERRVAQIVRDFMDAYALSAEIGLRLQNGTLDFQSVERLVGDSEESALFRLKEECHALFRFDKTSSQEELHAEELFDLAVGALFHEAMKFREGYYLTTTYRTHLERMVRAGSATGALAETFLRVFEAGQQRMMESASESVELFAETREQLLIMLQQMPQSTAIARILLADPERSARVFGVDLDTLLEQIYGSSVRGHHLATRGLLHSGHFASAVQVLDRLPETDAFRDAMLPLARGLERLYAEDTEAALEELEEWLTRGKGHEPDWLHATGLALDLIAQSEEPIWVERSCELRRELTALLPAAESVESETRPRAAHPTRGRRAQ